MSGECIMDCSERELLAEYVDGFLGGEEKEALEGHLKLCLRCAAEAEGQRQVRLLAASAPRFSAPRGFSKRVMAEISAAENEGGLFGWLWAMPAHLKLIEAAAVAAVVFIGVYSAGFLSERITGAPARNGETSLVASLSVEYLDPVPPESMADVYLTAAENGNEN